MAALRLGAVVLILHAVALQADPPQSFVEDTYSVSAAPAFASRCLAEWQEDCYDTYGHDEGLRQQLCDEHHERNYVKIRVLVPQEDILTRWAWFKPWHDFDRGWYMDHAPHFTEEGFKPLKLPKQMHAAVVSWYRHARHTAVPEGGEPAFGMYCNTGHDNDDWIVPYNSMDKELFNDLVVLLQSQLRRWTGQDVAEHTVTYGARQYHRGSVCGMHVDAPDTHAFGVVYHLYEKGLDEPWLFHYRTHKGEERQVTMEPGDVMLYEAATSMHGRKEPLRGDEYANLYFHFRSPNWVPDLREVEEKQYGPDRFSYSARYEETQGRPLYQQVTPLHRDWKAADPCLPLRPRNEPLMIEGGFMQVPARQFYEKADLEAAVALSGTLRPPLQLEGRVKAVPRRSWLQRHRLALGGVGLLVLCGLLLRLSGLRLEHFFGKSCAHDVHMA